jgi:hypothetical protein
MIDKDPLDYSFITYAWVLLLSLWGGLANFIAKAKRGEARWCNVTELVGELFISGGTGVLTFYLCEYYSVPPLLAAVCIAISGHMGTRLLFMLEKKLISKVKNS